MSIAGIASTLFSQLSNVQSSKHATLQSEFQQLAKDLQTGNLKAAQADFNGLQQTASTSQTSGQTFSQAASALRNDLQSGNLTSAQQAYASLRQDLQLFSTNPSSSAVSAPLSVSA